MPSPRRRAAAVVLALFFGIGIGGCTNQPPDENDRATCETSHKVITDLAKFGTEQSKTLDGDALKNLDVALGDLATLASSAPTKEIAALASSIRSSLMELKALAQTDPQGTNAATRERARVLGQQYVIAAQDLATQIEKACATK